MNKFRAKRTEGFHSKKERDRYRELCLLEKAGVITNLRTQIRYELEINQGGLRTVVGTYVLDFEYWDNEKQERICEDVKGYRKGCAYELFKLKKNLMRAIYGIEIQEV